MKLAISEIIPDAFDANIYEEGLKHLASNKLLEYVKLRTKIMKLAIQFMDDSCFVHPPVYMFSTLSDPLNHETAPAKITYYGKELSLTQSLIFQKMIIVSCSKIKRVFWLSPNIRLESSDDGKKYATEFTQLDFEVVNWNYEDAQNFAANLVAYIIFELKIDKRVKIITNLKREAYDYFDGATYRNFDIEIDGIEVCSGAEREYEHDRLKSRMEELNYPLEYFDTVLKLAQEKRLKPSAGAGIGIERLTKALLGIEDIQELYPFTRKPKEKLFL